MNSQHREFRPFTDAECELYLQQFIHQSTQSSSSLAWYDSFFSPWETSLLPHTPVAVIDLGGSKLRYAIAHAIDNHIHWLTPVQTEPSINNHTSPTEFIRWMLSKITPLALKHQARHLSLVLSYPHQPQLMPPHISAIITRPSKGINIPGFVGTNIGELTLQIAQEYHWKIDKLLVLNDSIATVLTSKSAQFGLIIATGGNICSIHPQLPHLRNVEAGNFDAIPHTQASQIIDRHEHPCTQSLEKQTTGRYLYQLLIQQLIIENTAPEFIAHLQDLSSQYQSGLLNYFQSSDFSVIELQLNSDQKTRLTHISDTLLTTSAQAWGIMLAGCINLNQLPQPSLTIPVTGGVLLNNPSYLNLVQQTTQSLTHKLITLLPTPDPIRGAAIASLQ